MNLIKIDLNLFATLEKHTPQSPDLFAIEGGSTVRKLLERLNISESEAKLIFINGIKTTHEAVLNDGDRVGIFPPVGGG